MSNDKNASVVFPKRRLLPFCLLIIIEIIFAISAVFKIGENHLDLPRFFFFLGGGGGGKRGFEVGNHGVDRRIL